VINELVGKCNLMNLNVEEKEKENSSLLNEITGLKKKL